MSKISKVAKSMIEEKSFQEKKPEANFMGGISYTLNPIDTLKMITTSSIFGEPQYYRSSSMSKKHASEKLPEMYSLFDASDESTEQVMLNAINNALQYDFGQTIEWAVELRKRFEMRLNPQMIMVAASIHPNRISFEEKNTGVFRKTNEIVMSRADESATQLSCYLFLNKGSKGNIPNVLKRSWKKHLESLSKYAVAKYKNNDIGMINVVRICHANNTIIDELMTTGNVQVEQNEKTWENLRSQGMSFKEIISTIKIGHMALLKNLRNIFSELDDSDVEFAKSVLQNLKDGVPAGKQFPFRYYSAYNALKKSLDCPLKDMALDAVEECVDISIANMPKLPGNTACLSDNSGSAWEILNSEYGSVSVAEINNLSSLLLCANSNHASLFKFGDELIQRPFQKRNGILKQARTMSDKGFYDCGGSTENGIWLFFEKAIKEKIHYDNIFVFSDQQAGHGGLYGRGESYFIDNVDYRIGNSSTGYIDVMKLLQKYRSTVNPKANFFTVQTAGYSNAIIPEYTYRGAVLYGWTGREATFADEIIRQWDKIEGMEQK